MKVQSKAMLTALAQHKERRRRERQKIEPADDSMLTQSSAIALLEMELQGFTATRPFEYANSVGMPLWEKTR